MTAHSIDDLVRLPQAIAVQTFQDGENRSFLRQLTAASSILAVISLIVNLSEGRYRPAAIWLGMLAFVGALILVRRARFYHQQLRRLLLALQLVLLAAVTLTVPDPLARVLLAGMFLPAMLLFCRLATAQYLGMAFVFLTTAAWFAFGPGGLAVPRDAVPAFVACTSATLIVTALAARITRKRKQRFLVRWSRERDRFTEHSRMQSELNDARAIQLSMLPSEPPSLGWIDSSSISLPATEVGGDYFEYIELSDSKLAIVIGDVAGHGVASGLVLSGVRSGLNLLRDRFEDPLEILSRLDTMIRDTAHQRMFVTLQIAIIDREKKTLSVANAGHPPLLAVTAEDDVLTLGAEGLPLGTRLEPTLQLQSQPVEEGDTILMYTDGVLEVHDAHGQPFGDERLAARLKRSARKCSARQIRDDILNAISSFKGDEMAQDDLTLVVLRLR